MSINLNKETKKISGKYIYIDDAKKDYIQDISIDTNIKQDSRDGYNELPIEIKNQTKNGVTVTNNGDGSITFNGTTIAYTNFVLFSNKNIIFPKDTYYLTKNNVSGTIETTSEFLCLYDKDNKKMMFGWSEGTLGISEEFNAVRGEIAFAQGTVLNNYTVSFMLTNSANKNKPYEQYGSMPSIEFPSEIKTPVGKQSFVAGNKNYWKQKELGYISNVDGSVTSGAGLIGDFIPIPNDATFVYFYGSNLSSSMNNSFANRVGFYDANKKWLGNQMKNEISKVSIYGGAKYIKASFSEVIENPMIAFSETDYTPHQSQVQDLDVGELLGTIVDKEDGSYFENRYKIVDAKDLNWYTVDNSSKSDTILRFNSTNDDALTIMDSPTSPKTLFSNLFKCEYIINAYTKECIAPHNGIVNHINMFIDKSRLISEDVNGLKTFLEENNCKILYPLLEPTYTKLTETQQAQWNKIKKMHTYEGVTNIYTINENGISPVINLEYTTKYAEEYDFYINENARFIVPEYGINYQVSMTESDLSDMPEASESAVKIAGKDGDVVLNTTYESKDFNIVAYTDDNLEPKDKETEKTKLVNFLHSIKNRTKNFGLLYREKFYPVKYNDKLTPTIYPKSIRFEIPIKSSKSLGYALEKKMIFGNGKEISNTIEETGCKIIIEGPIYGTNDSPMVITLNDYQMAYYNTVLEGNRLEIDTNNSTIKHISSNGEVTNVAAYYNHEYPKIKYGENEIKILSKIDSETQVYTEWYDLKI